VPQPPYPGPPPPWDAGRSDPEEIHDGLPRAPPEPDGSRRHLGRGLVLAGVAAGALVLGGTGYAVASDVSGGGAQPEEALPADALAFAKLDLDPAASQKAAVASLLDEFPDLGPAGTTTCGARSSHLCWRATPGACPSTVTSSRGWATGWPWPPFRTPAPRQGSPRSSSWRSPTRTR
jgi:hypothetical protein